jgi:hypothetical protein
MSRREVLKAGNCKLPLNFFQLLTTTERVRGVSVRCQMPGHYALTYLGGVTATACALNGAW